MITAADAQMRARDRALALVEHEFAKLRSKMSAYAAVARTIGVSESWVRKLIGRQPVSVAAHEYLNLHTAHERIESRAAREAEELKAARNEREQLLARLTACEAALGIPAADGLGAMAHSASVQARGSDRSLAQGG